MSNRPGPLFLERPSYRRRRLVDASRAVPIFGMVLFMVPLIWAPVSPETSLAARGAYVFAVWLGLVAVTALVSRRLQARQPRNGNPSPEPDRDAGDVL